MSLLVLWFQLIAAGVLVAAVVFLVLLVFLLRFVAQVRAAKDERRPAEGSRR